MNWARTAVGVGVLAVLAACGGGGGGSSSTSGGGGGGGSASVSGVASKGLLLNALVTAYAVNSDGSRGSVLATTSTSATDGSYTLSGLPAGALVLLEVTPKATGTKMIDETTNAEVDVLANSGFKLRAATSLESSGTTSAQITPFTDMAVKLAENNGGLKADVVTAANGSVSAFVGVSILADKPTFAVVDGNVVATNAAGVKLAAVSRMADAGAVDGCTGMVSGTTVDKVKCVVDYLAAQGTTAAAAGKLQTATDAVIASDAAFSSPLEEAKAGAPIAEQDTSLTVVPGAQTAIQEAKALIKSVRGTAAALSNKSDATSLAARVDAVAKFTYGVAQPLDDGTLRAVGAVSEALATRAELVAENANVPGFPISGYNWYAPAFSTNNVKSTCGFFTGSDFLTSAYSGGVLSTRDYVGCRILQQVIWGDTGAGYAPKFAVFTRVGLVKVSDTEFTVTSSQKQVPIVITTSGGGTTYAYGDRTAETSLGSGPVTATVKRTSTGASVIGELAPGVMPTWTINNQTGFYDEGTSVQGTKQVVSLAYSEAAVDASTVRRVFSGDIKVHDGASVQSQLSVKEGSFVQAKLVEGEMLPDSARLIAEGVVKSGFKVSGTLDLTNHVLTTERTGFKNATFNGSFTDVGGTAKLFDGVLTLVMPTDSGLGASIKLDGTLVVTGTNTLAVNLSVSQPTTLGDFSLSGRYTQGTTTFLLAVTASDTTPANDQLTFSTPAGVGFVAKPSDTMVDIKKGDVVLGKFNVSTGRLVYADGSYEQF
ncbi:hypothetical protein [Aquabacterium sp.]|uniref:hypothetical protein n=1 Tax=Aquabacterium sp. TaxID=1872578 RepID=UPI0035C6BBD8